MKEATRDEQDTVRSGGERKPMVSGSKNDKVHCKTVNGRYAWFADLLSGITLLAIIAGAVAIANAMSESKQAVATATRAEAKVDRLEDKLWYEFRELRVNIEELRDGLRIPRRPQAERDSIAREIGIQKPDGLIMPLWERR